jgi:DNA-binding NtrC family response regulator
MPSLEPSGIDRPMIGNSESMVHLRRQIEKASKGLWPVLILGETGTGKEVVARAICAASSQIPFVTIDCSSLVGTLIESELFGHAKGAFTGSAGQKLGLLEMADGGTAFLDEIGELPLDVQAKLLRALQDKEFRPVGSLTSRHSEFRVIAATNRDLAAEVARGNFRRDLYYRLNILTIRLQPLRNRLEDVPLLVDHFIESCGSGHVFTPELIEAFLAYDWPGNIRELQNTIQQMVAMNSGPLLHLHDLPSALRNHLAERRSRTMAAAATTNHPEPPAMPARVLPLAEVERQAILGALRYTRGDRTAAAALLGIGRTTLYRKLREYKLDPGTDGLDRMADCGSPSTPPTVSDRNSPA